MCGETQMHLVNESIIERSSEKNLCNFRNSGKTIMTFLFDDFKV